MNGRIRFEAWQLLQARPYIPEDKYQLCRSHDLSVLKESNLQHFLCPPKQAVSTFLATQLEVSLRRPCPTTMAELPHRIGVAELHLMFDEMAEFEAAPSVQGRMPLFELFESRGGFEELFEIALESIGGWSK